MSNELDEPDAAEICRYLSTGRLNEFLSITDDEMHAVHLYRRSLRLAGLVMPVINVIEVALRNAVDDQIARALEDTEWLLTEGVIQWKNEDANKVTRAKTDARKTIYANLTGRKKRALDGLAGPKSAQVRRQQRIGQRRGGIEVTQRHLIPELTLGFWKGLFSKDYEERLWKVCLKHIFPNRGVTRKAVATHLETVHHVRNKIAHHEPLELSRMISFVRSARFLLKELTLSYGRSQSPLLKFCWPFLAEIEDELAVWESVAKAR